MRTVWKSALILLVLLVVGAWFRNHWNHTQGNQLTGDAVGQWLAYGRLAGLLAGVGILVQLLLIGRVRCIERAFGLDRLSRLHHIVGFSLAVLIAAHLILVTAGHAAQADASWPAQILDFIRTWEDVGAAAAAVVLIVVALAFSVLILLRRMRYETWYATHLALYGAVVLVFGHTVAVGSDFADHRGFRIAWTALCILTAVGLVGYRFLRPLQAFARHRFTVARLQAETADVTSVCLEGRNLGAFPVKAGQFMIVRFLAPGFRWEAHPFSLSSCPDGKHLRLSIKAVGDFTRRIANLKPGTRVIVDGPHGIFTADRCAESKVLLLAGGIGITPVRSLAEELAKGGRDVLLLYANRNRASVVFQQELDDLTGTGRLRVVHILSEDPDWTGEKGRLDRDRIARLVPDVLEREVYLCGPPPMMKGLRTALSALGVPRSRIHFERFAL